MSTINRKRIGFALAMMAIASCAADERMDGEVPAIVSFGDEQALASIDKLAGCFSVRYQFVENGQTDFFYDGNIQYMDVQPAGEGSLVRNFLVLPDQTSFLHWVQEWTPVEDSRWELRVSDGAGNIRHESVGAWRFNQWEGNTAPAVKPNRDQERTDYDVIERRNSFQFIDGMVVQSEINVKSRDDGDPVASELGWIVYTLQENDEACAPAIDIAN